MPKKRLDLLVLERNLAQSREQAKGLIMAGEAVKELAGIDGKR